MLNTIQLIQQGDQKAFEILFKEYNAWLCAYSELLTKDSEMSREIVQEFFMKLWENRESLEVKSVRAYLFKSIHHNTVKHLNRSRKFESIDVGKEYGFVETHDAELAEKLESTINELPPQCKKIFVMSRMDNLKHNEIAQQLGISPKTVEVQIRKASIFLKERLKDYRYMVLFFIINKGF